eukprot:1357081-Pyramimonas_sp.AAC.1
MTWLWGDFASSRFLRGTPSCASTAATSPPSILASRYPTSVASRTSTCMSRGSSSDAVSSGFGAGGD